MAGQTLTTTILINAKTGNGFSKVGATLTELGSIVDGASQMLIGFGKDSIKVYRDYEKSMASAEVALATTYGRGSQQLNGVMKQLDTAATEWAATTIFHTNDVGNAISEAAHAGWDFDQIMSGIPAAMQLAQAGGLDLSEAVNYIVKSTTAAGIGFEDMNHWIDLWAFASNSSASNIEEFGEAMLKMGSTMRFASNPEELMTLLAVTANAGAVGSEAGTMIRNSMIRLIAPTDKARAAMAELGATSEEYAEVFADDKLLAANKRLTETGFSAYDKNGQLKSVIDTYHDLYVALGEVAGGYDKIEGNTDALQILTTIFPTRNTTEALNLLRAVADGSFDLYDAMMAGAAEGYGTYGAETMMDTLYGRIETFESKVERLKQLTGEALSEPLGEFLGVAGNFIDKVSGLDEAKFDVLVGGLSGIAFTGPTLLGLGALSRFIGIVTSSPIGMAAVGVTALTAALSGLYAYQEFKFESNFGDMALDITALKQSIDGITTSTDEELAPFRELSSQLLQLKSDYTDTVTAFSTDLSTAVLTGATLNPMTIAALKKQGESIHGYVLEGISTAREKSLGMMNTITPDLSEMSPEEAEGYNTAYDWLTDYYSGMESEATAIGERINNALEAALNGDIDTAQLTAEIQAALSDYDNIVAQWEAGKQREKNYAELNRAHRVSLDSMEEYVSELKGAYEADEEELSKDLDSEIGILWEAANQAYGRELSWEEFTGTDAYKTTYGNYEAEKRAELDRIYGERVQAAVNSMMSSSEFADTWAALNQIDTLARDKNGNIDFAAAQEFMSGINSSDLVGIRRALGELDSEWYNLPGMDTVADMMRTVAMIQSLRLGGTGELSTGPQYTEPLMPGIVQTPAPAPAQSTLTEIRPVFPGENPAAALRNQGVDIQVNGDTQQLTAQIAAEDGQTLMSYVDGNTDQLHAKIMSEDGQTVLVTVDGNADAIGAAIDRYRGQTVTVNIVGNNLLGPKLPGFAEGGRADEASIFGEAGPEWAIPEEHSDRTAQLLDAARAASGFTWPELLARNGGLNANPGNAPSTLVYSPTIYAQDATGVDEVLRQDKQRLDKYMRERELRERMEVYE